jgi:molybdopterin-guanine dinucleotide biosynthesis protein A
MFGVILCGGQSSRMQSDKAMLKLSDDTWAQAAVSKMTSQNLPVVLSVNSNQYNEYLPLFKQNQLIVDNESLKIHGPLCGVLSVHIQYPKEDLIVLACDMPLMKPVILESLLNTYHQQTSADAFVFTNNGEPEPLCAIYTAKALSYIMQLYQENKLVKHSMKFMLEHVHTLFIPLLDEQKEYFRNINTHAELNGL